MQFAQPIHEWTSKQTNKQNEQKNKQTNKQTSEHTNKKNPTKISSLINFNFDVGVLRSWWQPDLVLSIKNPKSNTKPADYNI